MINLNSYEVRKQSLQDLKGQNVRGGSGANGQNYKFRNQLQQFSSDHDGLTPNHNESKTFSNQNAGGNIVSSMSIKNDALFHNRGGILSRVKTQEAVGNSGNILNQQQTPARSRQDKVAQKALADMQERSKNLLQAVMKVKKTILDVHDRAMNEQELKSLEKQLE